MNKGLVVQKVVVGSVVVVVNDAPVESRMGDVTQFPSVVLRVLCFLAFASVVFPWFVVTL